MSEGDGSSKTRQRLGAAFGWIAGGTLGLLIDYGLFLSIGARYPVGISTFVVFVIGAFAGMRLADRLGDRAFRVLGIAAGVLLAIAVSLGVALLVTRSA